MARGKKNNVKMLDTDYAKEQYAKYVQQQKQIIFKRRRVFVVFALAIVAFVSISISLFNDYLRLQKLQDVRQETIAKNKIVANKMADLEQEVTLLKDKDYVAKVARSRFFYSKKNELIFPLPENETEPEAADKKDE